MLKMSFIMSLFNFERTLIERGQWKEKTIKRRNRFGIGNTFPNLPDCEVGIELEDGGLPGAAGSHWEMRTYHEEVMAPTNLGHVSFSNATLIALQDSGWYLPNYSYAKPLLWGDYRGRVGDKPYQNFPVGSPALEFPPGYLGKRIDDDFKLECTYDHKAIGYFTAVPNFQIHATVDGDPYDFPDFYDPDGIGLAGRGEGCLHADFSTLYHVFHGFRCQTDDNLMTSYGDFTPRSFCMYDENNKAKCSQIFCDSNNVLTINNYGDRSESAVCNESDQVLPFGKCPDPKRICGIINFKLNSARLEAEQALSGETSSDPAPKPSNVGLIVGVTIAAVVVVAGATVLAMFFVRKKNMGTDFVKY